MKKLFLVLLTVLTVSFTGYSQDFEDSYAIVPLNDTLTAVINIPNNYYLSGIQIIADTIGSATKIENFWVGSDNDTDEMFPLYDGDDGILVELDIAQNRSYSLKPSIFYTWKYMKLEFDAVFAVYTNQFIKLIFRRY